MHELEHVEHAAIRAGGDALASLAAGEGDAARIVRLARELVALLEAHFAKEEEILFPMARQLLSTGELMAIARGWRPWVRCERGRGGRLDTPLRGC